MIEVSRADYIELCGLFAQAETVAYNESIPKEMRNHIIAFLDMPAFFSPELAEEMKVMRRCYRELVAGGSSAQEAIRQAKDDGYNP